MRERRLRDCATRPHETREQGLVVVVVIVAVPLNNFIENIAHNRGRFMTKIKLRPYNEDQITRLMNIVEAKCAIVLLILITSSPKKM